MFTFLFLFVSTNNFISGSKILTDLTLSSLNIQNKPVLQYEDCLSQRKYFYQNQCWDLLTRGPCNEDQWLVLEQSEHEKEIVKCAKRKCFNQDDQYWPNDGFCYNAETARHYRLCTQLNTELATNKFGYGYCGCLKGDKVPYVKVISNNGEDKNLQPCYLLYTQGPCSRGQVLIPSEIGYGKCMINRCAVKRTLQWQQRKKCQQQPCQDQQPEQQQPTIIPWIDNKCYELGTQGPCNNYEQFVIFRDTMQPGCTNLTVHTTLGIFPDVKNTGMTNLSQKCGQNHQHKCQSPAPIDFPISTSKKGIDYYED